MASKRAKGNVFFTKIAQQLSGITSDALVY